LPSGSIALQARQPSALHSRSDASTRPPAAAASARAPARLRTGSTSFTAASSRGVGGSAIAKESAIARGIACTTRRASAEASSTWSSSRRTGAKSATAS
jgi:hypothetical protein